METQEQTKQEMPPKNDFLRALRVHPDQHDYDALKRQLTWGTYGEDGKGPLNYVTLESMSTEHLENTIITQSQMPPLYRKVMLMILKNRYQALYWDTSAFEA